MEIKYRIKIDTVLKGLRLCMLQMFVEDFINPLYYKVSKWYASELDKLTDGYKIQNL